MSPEQALNILDQISQPGKRFDRADYALADTAIQVLKTLVDEHAKCGEHAEEK